MTPQNFKKIARLLKEAYAELEKQAKVEGIPLVSPEYDTLVEKVREGVFNSQGVTREEYEAAKAEQETEKTQKQEKKAEHMDQILNQIEKLKGDKGDTGEQGPQGEMGPQGPRGAKGEKGDKGDKGDRGPEGREGKPGKDGKDGSDANIEPYVQDLREVQSSHVELYERVESLPIKEEKDVEALRTEFRNELDQQIKMVDMPDIRHLGVGLQGQIDLRIEGASPNRTTPKLTISPTAPANPKLYDIWLDIS